jgi:hypothetical protein
LKRRPPPQGYGIAVASEFGEFKVDLSAIAAETRLEVSELTFKDLVEITARWVLKERGI